MLNNIKKKKKKKDKNNMTQNFIENKKEIQTNDKKSMTVICKRNLSDNEILNNVFGEKNSDSNRDFTSIKNNETELIIRENLKNIRNNNSITSQSKTEKNKNRISLPQLNFKKKFKMKAHNIV